MKDRTEGLFPPLLDKAVLLVHLCKERDIPIVITQGLRTIEQQNALYAQGRTLPGSIVTYAKGGESYHNYGLAFDIAILKNGNPTWDTKTDIDQNDVSDYVDVGEIGELIGLEWGGRWKICDLPHFQMTFGLTIKELQFGKRPQIPPFRS